MEEEIKKQIRDIEIEEFKDFLFIKEIDNWALTTSTKPMPEKEKYIPFVQANYDIENDDITIEKANTMLPEDYMLIEDKVGENSYLAYSAKNNELILSYRGSVAVSDWREDFETLATNLLGARISQGEVMIDVADRYNELKDKPEKKKQFTENLKAFKKNVVAGYDKLTNFIKNNALEDLPLKDRPKIKILGHSLGSARAIGTLELIEHTDFKDGNPLYDYFDIESNVYNPAPYPVNSEGDFYFLNKKMRLNAYSKGHTRKDNYKDLTRMPDTDNILNAILFPLTRPAEILARPYLMAYDKIFGEQRLDNGDYYMVSDIISGIPDITRTAASTYKSGQNFNFGIIEQDTRALKETLNIPQNLLLSHITEGLYNKNQMLKRLHILEKEQDALPLKPLLTQQAFKNIFTKQEMKRHKIIKKQKKQNPVPFINKVVAEADEMFIRKTEKEAIDEYCFINKNDIKCSAYCANNPDIELCKFTDF